ncbi:chromosome segregation protein SMC [Shewanella aestuarii]|uniref:Chromosome partition protein Smc n=1 Tax=Shewanella aestuarii TaxID=1028752 RepID=A0A6G9QK46_9GAMM|nr:chromosome segregation protein SMC [Shewanella aestuarii]QIR14231.1 chromosome segregation protein SMC [Shewanella aestuarii]
MRLKQIKLAGFKSFVDPTKIPFDHPLTAIIGPNGCGKSNVIDAVRWVLGESSAKHLRGDSMTDVIFNGSSARRPISVAGVELVFENIQGRLTGQYASYQEISVKRQVNRDSESSYFLNGQKCRRKDITDLFMGTGLGPRSYAIIEQGTISRLIESKPQELRVFIEEAAGISRYKERRRETENRIRHTRENLERLNDIRQELGSQLERLSQQAVSAKQYREYKQQEREWHTQLLVGRYQELLAQLETIDKQISQLSIQEAQFAASQQSSDTVVLQLQQQIAVLTDEEQKLVAHYYQAGNQVTKFEQQLKHQQQQDSQREQQLTLLNQSLLEAKQKHQQLIEQHQLAVEAQQKLQPQVSELILQLEVLDEQIHIVDEACDDHRHALNQSGNQFNQTHTQLAVYQSRLEHQQILLVKQEQIIPALQQKLSQVSEQDFGAEIKQQQLELAKIDEQIAAELIAKSQLEQQFTAQQAELSQCQHHYQQCQHELASVQARLALISEWLIKQTGQSECQQLWQVIDVTPGYEKALDVLLQGISHANILPQAENAKMVESGFTYASELFEHPAVTSPVNLAPWLLNVRFSESLTAAKSMLPDLPPSALIATKDGYLLGHGFILSQANQQAALSLTVEQQALTDKQQELAQSTANALAAQTEQTQQVAQTHVLLAQHQQLLQQYYVDQTRGQARVEALNAQQKNHLANHQALVQELTLAKQQQQSHMIDVEALALQVEALEDNAQNLQKQQQQAQLVYDRTSAQLRKLKNNRAELERQQAGLNQQLQQINMQVAVSHQQLEQQDEKIAELLERQTALQQSDEQSHHSQWQAQRQLIQQQLEQQLLNQQTLQQKLDDNRSQQLSLQQSLDTSLLMQKQQLVSLQDLTQKIGALKLRREGLKGQADSQLQLLQEEQIQLQAAIALLPEQLDLKLCAKALDKVREQIIQLGAINLAAIEEYDTQNARKLYLDNQDADLNQGLSTLEDAIRKIDKETRTRFKATFEAVNADLMQLFPKVFGGGKAYLALTDDDLLETGVTIMAQPPGKKNSTIHLLSGGEKALTALSLVFAIFRLNPAPFCMLDEVDAPLDDANVERFCRLLQEMSQSVQFVYISHNKITMEMADQLIGVTMHEPGVSRIVAVDIEAAVALADAV